MELINLIANDNNFLQLSNNTFITGTQQPPGRLFLDLNVIVSTANTPGNVHNQDLVTVRGTKLLPPRKGRGNTVVLEKYMQPVLQDNTVIAGDFAGAALWQIESTDTNSPGASVFSTNFIRLRVAGPPTSVDHQDCRTITIPATGFTDWHGKFHQITPAYDQTVCVTNKIWGFHYLNIVNGVAVLLFVPLSFEIPDSCVFQYMES